MHATENNRNFMTYFLDPISTTVPIISFQPNVTSRLSATFTDGREPMHLQLRHLVMGHQINALQHCSHYARLYWHNLLQTIVTQRRLQGMFVHHCSNCFVLHYAVARLFCSSATWCSCLTTSINKRMFYATRVL